MRKTKIQSRCHLCADGESLRLSPRPADILSELWGRKKSSTAARTDEKQVGTTFHDFISANENWPLILQRISLGTARVRDSREIEILVAANLAPRPPAFGESLLDSRAWPSFEWRLKRRSEKYVSSSASLSFWCSGVFSFPRVILLLLLLFMYLLTLLSSSPLWHISYTPRYIYHEY